MIIDPGTGEEVFSPKEIKEVSLKYTINLLRKKDPPAKYAKPVLDKRLIHKERMNEMVPDDIDEMPLEAFNKAFDHIRSKPGRKYEFFKNAGSSLKLAISNLFRII